MTPAVFVLLLCICQANTKLMRPYNLYLPYVAALSASNVKVKSFQCAQWIDLNDKSCILQASKHAERSVSDCFLSYNTPKMIPIMFNGR